jgi:AraC-like DNA-binding protein
MSAIRDRRDKSDVSLVDQRREGMLNAKKEQLGLSAGRGGSVVYHEYRGIAPSPHKHEELEVNLVVRGSATYLLGDRRYDLGERTLTWLFPDQNHVLVRQSEGFAMWWAVFGTGLLRRSCGPPETAGLLERNPLGRFCRRLDARGARRIEGLFAEVKDAGSTGEGGLYDAGLAYLLLSSWEAFRTSEDVVEGLDLHPAVERAAVILRDETGAQDLPQLARTAGLSPSRLSRLFKQQVGFSISEYRNERRLERFLELYGRGRRIGTLEAALEAGFGSYAQFHRVFRRAMGASPEEYRRKLDSAAASGGSPAPTSHSRSQRYPLKDLKDNAI